MRSCAHSNILLSSLATIAVWNPISTSRPTACTLLTIASNSVIIVQRMPPSERNKNVAPGHRLFQLTISSRREIQIQSRHPSLHLFVRPALCSILAFDSLAAAEPISSRSQHRYHLTTDRLSRTFVQQCAKQRKDEEIMTIRAAAVETTTTAKTSATECLPPLHFVPTLLHGTLHLNYP